MLLSSSYAYKLFALVSSVPKGLGASLIFLIKVFANGDPISDDIFTGSQIYKGLEGGKLRRKDI